MSAGRLDLVPAWPLPETPAKAKSLDDCVRMVTAFDSFEDLKNTQPTYAPTFYLRGMSYLERVAINRVAAAFNAWAGREGRQRLAEVRS